MGTLASLISSLLVSLKELDYGALDADRQLDLQLIYGAALVEHRMLLEHDWCHRDPARCISRCTYFRNWLYVSLRGCVRP